MAVLLPTFVEIESITFFVKSIAQQKMLFVREAGEKYADLCVGNGLK